MPDNGIIGTPIKFDSEDVKSISIPVTIPSPISTDENQPNIPVPLDEPVGDIVEQDSSIVIPDDLPTHILIPEEFINITIPTEWPRYTTRERLSDEITPGRVNLSVLQEGEPLLNPNIFSGFNSGGNGMVSWGGESAKYLSSHLTTDFLRTNNQVFINRTEFSTNGTYYFVSTNLDHAGRLSYISTTVGARNTFNVIGTILTGNIENDEFATGFNGQGYSIYQVGEGPFVFEIDNTWIRGSIRTFNEEVNRIRSSNGSYFISSSAEIISFTDNAPNYTFGFNVNLPFSVDDIIITKRLDGITLKETIWKVSSINGSQKTCVVTKLVGTNTNVLNCYATRIGNATTSNRQGSVYFTDDESNTPFINVVDGVTSDTNFRLLSANRARIGNISGINDTDFGQLTGYGIYVNRLFAKGTVLLSKDSILYTTAGSLTANQIEAYLAQNDIDILALQQADYDFNVTLSDFIDDYYTKINLQTSSQASVHWDNLTNVPTSFPYEAHTHAISEVTNLADTLANVAMLNTSNTFDTGTQTFAGLVQLYASTTTAATFNIPHGDEPTTPVDGDIWTTTSGFYVMINGVVTSITAAVHTHYQMHLSDGTTPFVYTEVNNGTSINTFNVEGDILQIGEYTTYLSAIKTTEDVIILRHGATAALDDGSYYVAGLIAKYYNGTDDCALVFDKNANARIGSIDWEGQTYNNTKIIAVRADSPSDGFIAYWDDANTQIDFKEITPGDIGAEPDLGLPSNDNYVLSSTALGVRSWIAAPAAQAVASWGTRTQYQAGSLGEIYVDDDFLYICVVAGEAGNATWKKAMLMQL